MMFLEHPGLGGDEEEEEKCTKDGLGRQNDIIAMSFKQGNRDRRRPSRS